MGARRITIEFLGKDVSADKTARAVEQRFGKLGTRLDKVGRAAGKVLAGGLALGAVAAVKAGQAAAEDEAAQVKLAQTMRNAAGASKSQVSATEDWIAAQGKALGIADDDLRPALEKLVIATGDVGKAQSLASLAMDVSAGTGKNLEAVSMALAKAQNGNVGALGRLGIATKDANGKTLSFEQITKNLASTFKGQAAKSADTVAGKQRTLAVQFGELQEQIGEKLLPVMAKLTAAGLKIVDWVSRNTTTAGILVGVLGALAGGLWAASVAVRAIATASQVWTAAQWLLNAALTANPIGLVIVALAALGAAVVIAYKKSETFRNIVNGAFSKVLGIAGKVVRWFKSNWPLLLAILTGPIGIATLAIVKNWDLIKSKGAAVVGWVRDIPNKLRDQASRWGSAGKALIGAFVNGMRNAAGIVSGISGKVWSSVKGLLNGAIDRINRALEFKISIPASPDVNINPPDIPHLYTGGVVKGSRRGTLAVLGDRGHDEAVIPLSGPNAPRGVGGQALVINIYGALNASAAAAEIEKLLRLRSRETRRQLLVAT